jgi:hypothetical protein
MPSEADMSPRGVTLAAMAFALVSAAATVQPQDPSAARYADPLLKAVLSFDTAAVEALLKQGVSPDAKDRTDHTALFFAAQDGSTDIVRLLLQYGADVSIREKEHGETALSAAARRKHGAIVQLLLAKDPGAAGVAAWNAVYQNDRGLLEAAMATERLSPEDLCFLLEVAQDAGSLDVAARLREEGASPPPRPAFVPPPAVLSGYVGRYTQAAGAKEMTVSLNQGALYASLGGQPLRLLAVDADRFIQEVPPGVRYSFQQQSGRVVGATVREVGSETRYTKADALRP